MVHAFDVLTFGRPFPAAWTADHKPHSISSEAGRDFYPEIAALLGTPVITRLVSIDYAQVASGRN
jgi:response regulator RpfG family c-di-GMP phosphodiesterase